MDDAVGGEDGGGSGSGSKIDGDEDDPRAYSGLPSKRTFNPVDPALSYGGFDVFAFLGLGGGLSRRAHGGRIRLLSAAG